MTTSTLKYLYEWANICDFCTNNNLKCHSIVENKHGENIHCTSMKEAYYICKQSLKTYIKYTKFYTCDNYIYYELYDLQNDDNWNKLKSYLNLLESGVRMRDMDIIRNCCMNNSILWLVRSNVNCSYDLAIRIVTDDNFSYRMQQN